MPNLSYAQVAGCACDGEGGQADLCEGWIVQAEGAFGNSRNGFAFELSRQVFLQVRGVTGEVREAFGAKLRAVDEAQEAVAAGRGSPHEFESQAAHRIAR